MSVNLDGLHSRVERHLEPVVKEIAQTIKECATKCDSFANCNVLGESFYEEGIRDGFCISADCMPQ